MGETVQLLVDPLRGERIPLELPLTFATPPTTAARDLGLGPWVDLTDPLVARAVVLLREARNLGPPVPLALLGGAANRCRCPASNSPDGALRRPLHDIDVACLLKEVRRVRAFVETVHERAGSAMRFFETQGDRIFNATGEGRRLRYHLTLGQDGARVAIGTMDLLCDEFRFCQRLDLRDDVRGSSAQRGTLPLADLLLAKLQFIQRVPGEAREKAADRVLVPFGRRDVLLGPEAKDVQDVLALLVDHDLDEGPDGISPSRLADVLGHGWGWWKTVSLNLEMIERSPILARLPEAEAARVRERLGRVAEVARRVEPKRPFAFLGGMWWEEVDATPAVEGTVAIG